MPGLAKLGFSKNVFTRMQSLCTTGVPVMFDCICAKKVENMRQAESFLFSDLAQYRFNPNREFFKVDDEIIKTSFDKIEGEYIDISTFNKNYIRESVKSEQNHIDDNDDNIIAFKCKRCGYKSKYKKCLLQHLNNKIKCKSNDETNNIDRQILLQELIVKNYNDITFICEYCEKKFNSKSSMYRHKKICKKNNENILERLDQLESKNNELKLELIAIKDKKPKIIATNNIQNITNNIIVKLNNFGQENMESLPETLINNLFINLNFRDLLANLHCNPKYSENQNVRIKSIKRNTMEIFRNNKWNIMTFTNGLTELLLQGHKIFKDYYKNDKVRILEDMSKDEIKDALIQLEKIEKLSKDEIKPLLIDLQMMLEEYREHGNAISII
jgi:hypothetical protein